MLHNASPQVGRWIVWGALAVGALAMLWALVTIRLVVFPRYDQPERADAIVILGPVDRWRVDLAERLVDEGVANVIAMPAWTDGFTDSHCHWDRDDVETICFEPEPATTQGEAKWTKEQIAARGWRTVVVITVDAHVERARFIFDGCVGDDASMLVTGQPPPNAGLRFYTHHLLYQSGAFVKAIFITPGC